MFQDTVQQYGSRPAVGMRTGKSSEYTYWTYNELAERVRAFRRGLAALGLKKGDRIAIVCGENQVEWTITDLASQALGVIIVSIYGTLPASQLAYYLNDSGARILIVSDEKQIAKVLEFRSQTPQLETVIAMSGAPELLAAQNILPFCAVYDVGSESNISEADLDAQAASVDPDDVATLIYTSGTTGDPKGAMLTHRNLLHTPQFVVDEPSIVIGPEAVFLSFLPLSHITERMGGHYLPLILGGCIVFSHGVLALQNELATVQPHVMLCVPRLFDMMYERVKESIPKLPDKERKAATWAIPIGMEFAKLKSEGKPIPLTLKLQHAAAEKLVFPKLRQKITGGKMRFFVSGGAPFDPETMTFMLGIGLCMMEGYGLSETCIISINLPGTQRIGTVGPLMPHTEVKLEPDGEILMRGQGRMKGYWNKPEATAETIDEEGWLHTGDIGEFTEDGFLRITDRKKDILVLSSGKKVAPQPIETKMKHSPFIQDAVLMADQATVIALIFPALEKLCEWARAHSLETHDTAALVQAPDVLKLFKAEIDKHTADLADFEKVKRFKIATQEATIAGGEWTPTLKIKRKFVAQKYADLIAAMTR
jgi:long-chain acyl-CoA synthetase